MSASKLIDLIGCQKGLSIQQSGALQAYTQSELGGTETLLLLARWISVGGGGTSVSSVGHSFAQACAWAPNSGVTMCACAIVTALAGGAVGLGLQLLSASELLGVWLTSPEAEVFVQSLGRLGWTLGRRTARVATQWTWVVWYWLQKSAAFLWWTLPENLGEKLLAALRTGATLAAEGGRRTATTARRCLARRRMAAGSAQGQGPPTPGAVVLPLAGCPRGNLVALQRGGEWDEIYVVCPIPSYHEVLSVTTSEAGDRFVWVVAHLTGGHHAVVERQDVQRQAPFWTVVRSSTGCACRPWPRRSGRRRLWRRRSWPRRAPSWR